MKPLSEPFLERIHSTFDPVVDRLRPIATPAKKSTRLKVVGAAAGLSLVATGLASSMAWAEHSNSQVAESTGLASPNPYATPEAQGYDNASSNSENIAKFFGSTALISSLIYVTGGIGIAVAERRRQYPETDTPTPPATTEL